MTLPPEMWHMIAQILFREDQAAYHRLALTCKGLMSALLCPRVLRKLPRTISYDLGTTNLGIWAGGYEPEDVVFPWRFHHWRLVNLKCGGRNDTAVFNFVEEGLKNLQGWTRMYKYVCIEQQPKTRGNMRTLGHGIQSFHYTLRRLDPQIGTLTTKGEISFVSAKNKLNLYEMSGCPYPVPELRKPRGGKITGYDKRKMLAIEHTRLLLRWGISLGRVNERWLNFFESHKKKDDLADAWLQGAWLLSNMHRRVKRRKTKTCAQW